MGYNGFIRAIRHSALLSGEFCGVNCDFLQRFCVEMMEYSD